MTRQEKFRGTVLITGGAKRIGKAMALSLASCGYRIILHYNQSEKEAQRLQKQIEKLGGACLLVRADFSNRDQTVNLIPGILKQCPTINLLINNASLYKPSTIQDVDIDSLYNHFSINFHAPYILTAQFAKYCQRGHIINILDTHVLSNQTGHSEYLLSKKALLELTKMAAVELAPKIRVNGIAPGLILPPEDAQKGHLDRLARKIPLRKKGDVHQITLSLKFLLENPYVTGQILFNDGGEHLT